MTTYDCWTPPHKLQLPYMKLLLKVHNLNKPASYDNLTKVTGRPIITTHIWITSNPWCLLLTELDSIYFTTEKPF